MFSLEPTTATRMSRCGTFCHQNFAITIKKSQIRTSKTRSFREFQETVCVSNIDIYLLPPQKIRCTYVCSVIQLCLLLATALVVGSFKISECSRHYNDNLKFLAIFCVLVCFEISQICPIFKSKMSRNRSCSSDSCFNLSWKRKEPLAVHYGFKSRQVRGAIQRGQLLRQVRKRSGWITSITSYSFNYTEENHQGTISAMHSFHRTFVNSVGDGVQVVSP